MLFLTNVKNLKNLKYDTFKKTVVSVICGKCKNEDEKLFKE